jgi:hypothetical protein
MRCHAIRSVAVALALACAAPAGCMPPSAPTVSMRMTGNVRDATVTIDDQYLGKLAFVAERGVALPPGRHRISVEKTGYFPWDTVVDVHEGDPPVYLEAVLQPIPE